MEKESTNEDQPSMKAQDIQEGGVSPLFVKPTKFLNTYPLKDVIVQDEGLRKYINLDRTTLNSGRNHRSRIRRLNINIIERFLCALMRTGKSTGKKAKIHNLLFKSLTEIEHRLKVNPIQTLVQAIESSAPEIEQVKIRTSGNFRAVEISPSRRLSIAIRNLSEGAYKNATKKKSIRVALTEEIIEASKGSINSYAISKKTERENLALSVK